jgi:hypothetical protein
MREAHRSPQTNAEVKNGGAIPPLPHMFTYRGAQLVKFKKGEKSKAIPVTGREGP